MLADYVLGGGRVAPSTGCATLTQPIAFVPFGPIRRHRAAALENVGRARGFGFGRSAIGSAGLGRGGLCGFRLGVGLVWALRAGSACLLRALTSPAPNSRHLEPQRAPSLGGRQAPWVPSGAGRSVGGGAGLLSAGGSWSGRGSASAAAGSSAGACRPRPRSSVAGASASSGLVSFCVGRRGSLRPTALSWPRLLVALVPLPISSHTTAASCHRLVGRSARPCSRGCVCYYLPLFCPLTSPPWRSPHGVSATSAQHPPFSLSSVGMRHGSPRTSLAAFAAELVRIPTTTVLPTALRRSALLEPEAV